MRTSCTVNANAPTHIIYLFWALPPSQEAKSKAERQAKFEEGNRLSRDFSREKIKLECSRDKIMDELRQKGVNPKYLAEINTVDITKLMGV